MKSLLTILNESSENDLVKSTQDLMYRLEDAYPVKLWVQYSKISNVLIIGQIEIEKKQRGSGIGTQVMEEILEFADEKNLRVALTPTKDFGGSVKRLKDFYSGFGFKPYKGYEFRESMVRMPK